MRDPDLFAQVTADALADDLFNVQVAPVSGGEPGITSDLDDAFGWAKGGVFDPVSSYLTGKIKDLIRDMVSAVSGFFSIAGWWVYKWLDGAIRTSPEYRWRLRFPHPSLVKGLPPWYYFMKAGQMIQQVVVEWLSAVAGWVWDQVQPAIEWAVGESRAVGAWVWGQVQPGIEWIVGEARAVGAWMWGQVQPAVEWAVEWVRAVGAWLWDQVQPAVEWAVGEARAVGAWMWGQVQPAIEWAVEWVRAVGAWVWDQVNAGFAHLQNVVHSVVIQGGQNLVAGIRDAFDWVFDKVVAAVGFIGDQVATAWQKMWEHVLGPWVDLFERKLAIPEKVLRGDYERVQDFIDDLMDPPRNMYEGVQLFMFALIVIIPSLLIGFIPAFSPINEKWAATIWSEIGGQVLPVRDALDAWNREIMDEGDAVRNLERQGYSGPELAALKELRMERPGVQDLVRFVVREVFRPEISEPWGAFTELPEQFITEAARSGLSDEHATWFWAAHWELPSTNQAFEMLHRNVITLPELEDLLRAQDVLPYWREPLTKIAYRPFTRVDVRRMYDTGDLDREGVLRAYLDLGYDDEKAELMTSFTINWVDGKDDSTLDTVRQNTQAQIINAYKRGVLERHEAVEALLDLRYTDQAVDLLLAVAEFDMARNPYEEHELDIRELTRAVILEAYREGVWDRGQAQRELEIQGYLPLSADLLLQLEDVAVVRDLRRAEVRQVETLYKGGHIDRGEGRRQLVAAGHPAPRVDLRLQEWDVEIDTPSKELSVSQLGRALEAGLVDDVTFRRELAHKGYSERDAILLLALERPELDVNRELSRSLVERLYKGGSIDRVDALARLQALGYGAADSELVLADLEARMVDVDRELPRGVVERLYRDGSIDRVEALTRLQAQGYSAADSELVLADVDRDLPRAMVERLYKDGSIDRAEALTRLQALGYSAADSELVLASVEARMVEA